jgi:hypothetical protein
LRDCAKRGETVGRSIDKPTNRIASKDAGGSGIRPYKYKKKQQLYGQVPDLPGIKSFMKGQKKVLEGRLHHRARI